MSISITEDYSITNHSASLAQREKVTYVSAVQATATFTFSSKPNEGSHITIVNAAGTSKTFEIDDNADGTSGVGRIAVTGITAAGGGGAGTAVALKNTINAQSGFGITAATPSSGKILLTQDTAGTVGNKGLSVDNSVHWNSTTSVNVPVSFTSGADTITSTSFYHDPGVGPFRVGLRGPANIRLQPISGHYQTFIGEQKL